MSALQKFSVYNLAVCVLFFIVWGTLYTLFGMDAALPSFSLMALLAFGTFFMGGGKKKTVFDERLTTISQKAANIGFRVFWFYYVGYSVVLIIMYDDTIPHELFMTLFIFSLFLLIAGISAAALLMESADSPEPPGLVEAFSKLSLFRRTNLMALIVYSFVMTPFLIKFPVDGPLVVGLTITTTWFMLFFLTGVKRGHPLTTKNDERAFERARAFSRRLLAVLLPVSLALVWTVGLFTGSATAGHFVMAAFLAVCAAIIAQPVASIAFAGHRQATEQGASQ